MTSKRVLIVATSPRTRGGISSVIKAHQTGDQWKLFHCRWIATHRDSCYLVKLLFFVRALLLFLLFVPFYDLVHIHIAAVTRKLPFVFLTKLFGKKLIIHFHFPDPATSIYDKKLSPRYGWCVKKADCCITLSQQWKTMIEGVYHADNIVVLYNPCATVDRSPYYGRNKCILFAGTLIQRKGAIDLLHAFAGIANKYPDWRLVFAGNGMISEYTREAERIGIANQVEFLGWISGSQKAAVFNSASIFCLPSYAEGFPMAVLDALAYGIPVVTTPVGGVTDVLRDGENMLSFTPGDVKSLSGKLELLIENPDLRARLSVASSMLADNTFNVKDITQKLSDIYSELLRMTKIE